MISQGSCCKGAHYILGVFGVLLVLTVCALITVETVRSVLVFNEQQNNATGQ